MTLPWEAASIPAPTAPPAIPAESMTPDPPAPPLTAVATDRVTGNKVDISPALREAIQQSVDAMVAQHPLAGAVTRSVASRDFSDRSLMRGSALDASVAIVASVSTIISPDSRFTAVAWLVAAVLASKTLISAALNRVIPETA